MVRTWLVWAVCMAGMAGAASGATYYVSPAGADANPGTQEQPWLTVQKAADSLSPGDTVLIKAGTYAESVLVKRSGAEGKPITFKNFPDQTPIIDGANFPNPLGVFRIVGQKYVVVSGIRAINGLGRGESGIHCENSDKLLITKCQTDNTFSSGIKLIQCTDVVIDGNDVARGCQGGAEECITVKIDSDRIQVSNNHVHDGRNEGIDIKEGARNVRVFNNHIHHIARQGLYADAWDRETYNIEFFGNVVHDCGFGMAACAETGGLLHDIRYINNIVYNLEGPGMVVASWGREGNHPIDGVYFINNTIVKTGARWGGGLRLENPEAKNIVVRNNIFVGCGSPTVQMFAEPVSGGIDHNLFDAEGEWQGINRIIGAPMFVDPEHGDFRLKPGSPGMDAGAAEGAPATDIEGQKRPFGKGVDMGADEVSTEPVAPNAAITTSVAPAAAAQ